MLAASSGDMKGAEAQDSVLESFPSSFSKPTTNPRTTPKPSNWLGVTAGMVSAKQAIAHKDLPLAERHLRDILEFAPAEAEAWHILAAVLNRQGQREEACACLRRTQQLNNQLKAQPSADDTTLPTSKRMAKLMWSQGDRAEALAMLDMLLLQTPQDDALLQLQCLWLQQSNGVTSDE